MLTPEQVKTLITAELDCTHVDVEGDGHHFFAVIVSPAFAGKRLIERHRLVMDIARAKLDSNDALLNFALTLEKVCIDTVESGFMTKDLALLVGPDQGWMTTTGFLDKIDENLKKAMGA